MDRRSILDRLKANETVLRQRGVGHAALFGSRARGDHGPESDIDIMVELQPDAPMNVFAYVGSSYHRGFVRTACRCV